MHNVLHEITLSMSRFKRLKVSITKDEDPSIDNRRIFDFPNQPKLIAAFTVTHPKDVHSSLSYTATTLAMRILFPEEIEEILTITTHHLKDVPSWANPLSSLYNLDRAWQWFLSRLSDMRVFPDMPAVEREIMIAASTTLWIRVPGFAQADSDTYDREQAWEWWLVQLPEVTVYSIHHTRNPVSAFEWLHDMLEKPFMDVEEIYDAYLEKLEEQMAVSNVAV